MEERIDISVESSAEVTETESSMPLAEMDPEVFKSLSTELTVNGKVPRRILPASRGEWSDPEQRGNCVWLPDPDAIYHNRRMGLRMTFGEMMDRYHFTGVTYFNGEPDFSPFEDELIGHVTVDRVPSDRKQAKDMAAEQFLAENPGWTREGLDLYMKSHGLVWHECADGHTMRAVPYCINDAFRHRGGIGLAEIKDRMYAETGAEAALDGYETDEALRETLEETMEGLEDEEGMMAAVAAAEIRVAAVREELPAEEAANTPEEWQDYSGLRAARAFAGHLYGLLASGEWKARAQGEEQSFSEEWGETEAVRRPSQQELQDLGRDRDASMDRGRDA